MNAAAELSGLLLQRFEDEQAQQDAAHQIKREPLSGRLHHQRPFGGGEASEVQFDRIDADQASSFSRQGFGRSSISVAPTPRRAYPMNDSQMSTTAGHDAWATHPSIASRASSVAFGSEQPDIKPMLGWYGEDAGEESMRQLATMQARLNQRLGPEYVSARQGPGGGPKLHYLEGWKAIDLANDVFGFNGWSTNVVRLDTDFIDPSPDGTRFNVGVSAIMRVTLRDGTFHEDIGYGHIENAKGKAAALEKAKKEAVTDALKRSLRTFGRLVGNCMYDKKYLETVSKMRADPQKYDVTQLHRRTDSHAPAPPMKQEASNNDESFASTSTNSPVLARSASMAPAVVSRISDNHMDSRNEQAPVLQRANTSLPAAAQSSTSNEQPSADEVNRLKAERQALALQRQQAFQKRQEEMKANVAQAAAAAKDREQQQGSASGSSSAGVSRPPPQLKRAPPAALPPSPPKQVSDHPAGKVYGTEPTARWASRGSSAAPQVRPDTAQANGDEQAQKPGQPRRSGSAGRFLDPGASPAGGVTSLSDAAGLKRSFGGEARDPLQTLDLDESGEVKRQRR